MGKCSDGLIDHDGDIISPKWMAAAVKDWISTYPAVRLQHRPDYPAGKGLEAWQDDSGATFLRALIVDDNAKKMVRKGVLRAYSVGISNPVNQKSSKCPRFLITGGKLTEVSLVDSPSNARCGITIAKMAGGTPVYVGKTFTGKLSKAEKQAIKQWHPSALELQLRADLNSANPMVRETARMLLEKQAA